MDDEGVTIVVSSTVTGYCVTVVLIVVVIVVSISGVTPIATWLAVGKGVCTLPTTGDVEVDVWIPSTDATFSTTDDVEV